MIAAVMVITLAGLFIPILLILTAIVVDLVVVIWALYRWSHDEMIPGVERYLHAHVGAPIGRFAHAHHFLTRPH